MEQEQGFIDYIEQSIIKNWDRNALTDYKGITLQYKDVARKIAKFHIVLESAGIRPGDKIAVCGRNSAHWAVAFLATVTYGAVIVPILHEFKADNIHNIVNHSEAKLLFVGDRAWENLNEEAMPLLMGIVLLTDFCERCRKLNPLIVGQPEIELTEFMEALVLGSRSVVQRLRDFSPCGVNSLNFIGGYHLGQEQIEKIVSPRGIRQAIPQL